MIQGHGGNIFAVAGRLGCRPDEITDMSSNINPLGTMPGLIDHLKTTLDRIRILPEVDGRASARAVGHLLGTGEDRILAGGGTTQFIYTVCPALASQRVLIVGPTYADYADGCRMHGIEPDFFLAQAETGFRVNTEALSAMIAGYYDTVFLCNPNNPTGQLIPREQLTALCREHPKVRFLIDESYLPFVPADQSGSMCHCELDNVGVLWSVSKIFGMPGLRAGFLVANQSLLSRFSRFMQPWCVNSLAQEAVRFLGDNLSAVDTFITQTRQFLAAEGAHFCARLQSERLTVFPSLTSYFLLQLPPDLTAAQVCDLLLERRFLIRNCSNFLGLNEQFIRVALKDAATNLAVTGHLLDAVASGRER